MGSLSCVRRGLSVALGFSFLLLGCTGTKDPHQPGTLIGTFHIDATRTASTCGEGALGSTATWAFDVSLSRAPGEIFWNNGVEQIPGELAADDKTFSFDTGIVMNMRDESAPSGLLPCSVSREDHANGKLAEDDASLTGDLSYAFTPTSGSSCEDLVLGEAPIFAALPCSMSYALKGTRTSTKAP